MIEAGFWGFLSGSALILGALVAWFIDLPQRLIAGIMAFGSGVLISAVAFDLMDEAFRQGGLDSTAIGFIAGALIYTAANIAISNQGARHRKRSGSNTGACQPHISGGGGLAIAVGALLDGVPESIVIGISLLDGGTVSTVTVAAIFLSNLPEGLSSAAGMKKAGRGPAYIFGVWTSIALASGLAAMLGNGALAGAGPEIIAAVTAVAAGAILAMLVDTMIPEATEGAHDYSGLITAIGFLLAFFLTNWAGNVCIQVGRVTFALVLLWLWSTPLRVVSRIAYYGFLYRRIASHTAYIILVEPGSRPCFLASRCSG